MEKEIDKNLENSIFLFLWSSLIWWWEYAFHSETQISFMNSRGKWKLFIKPCIEFHKYAHPPSAEWKYIYYLSSSLPPFPNMIFSYFPFCDVSLDLIHFSAPLFFFNLCVSYCSLEYRSYKLIATYLWDRKKYQNIRTLYVLSKIVFGNWQIPSAFSLSYTEFPFLCHRIRRT